MNNNNYNLLIEKIDTFTRKYYLNKLLRGVVFFGGTLFCGYVVIILSEYWGHFSTLLRGVLFYGYILINMSVFGWLVLPPLLAYFKLGKIISHAEAAQIIGTHFTDVKDKLLNTLQLKQLADENPNHRLLIEASIDQKIFSLKTISFPSAIRIKENMRYVKWAAIPFGVIIILAFTAPAILKDSTERLIKHNKYFEPVSPFQFVIVNPSLSVVQGDDLKLDLKLIGDKFPNEVYLEIGNNTFKLDKESISRFHYSFSNLQKTVHFKFIGGDFSSREYDVIVNLKPSLLRFDVDLQYPAYLHKKNETLNNAGDLTIPAGTTVHWAMHTQNASEVLFKMNASNTYIKGADNTFLHTARILKTSNYTLKAINALVTNGDSAIYHINVVADEPPTITVYNKPDSASSKAIYFNGTIQDDHGFSGLMFHYTISGNKNEKARAFTKMVKADLNTNQASFFYFWDLNELNAKPGEQVKYYFEVADNDAVIGPKKTRSTAQVLNVPTEQEISKQLDVGTQSVKQKMQSAIKLSAQIERESQKLTQLLINKNTLSFDEKKQVEDLLQKRKELESLVKDIQKENKQNQLNRQENTKQDEAILEKQKQIEELFNNVLDEKTRELLKNLQQMLEKNQKELTQDAVSKMQMDSKSLKKELDRVLELYKKLEFDQKLNESIEQLNKLAQKLEQLSLESKQAKSDQKSLQQQQEQLNKEFKDLEKSMDDLKQKNEQLDPPGNFENPTQDEKNIKEQLDKSADELNKNNKGKASQSQQQAAKQMQQLSQKLKQSEQQGEESANQININQLREIVKHLINSSLNQENIMETMRGLSTADPGYVTWTQKQMDIKSNMKNVEDSLYSLSKRVPQIQSTVNKEIAIINTNLDQSIANLADRKTSEANRNQQYTMTSMNNLALMLSEALEQMQKAMKNAKPGKGKQPSLSQLGQMQQQLNQNMQKMREQMQEGNKGKPQQGNMSEQLAKMARQQQSIRQALQQINKQENKDGRKGLGDLDKIAKEMEQTERDLVNKQIFDETLKRQQQIHTRLLEAERADQQRDQDQQRESNAGKTPPPGYIKALQYYQQMSNKQTEQIHTVSPALNFYYKNKVKIYFDQINGK